ncbi:MAG: hypothetical protein QOH58_236 [Thermoleophilaceae bacterium]|jgi:hypothetical protein|nr:hypothetical protein [Thermoleophilaceae bacterium]
MADRKAIGRRRRTVYCVLAAGAVAVLVGAPAGAGERHKARSGHAGSADATPIPKAKGPIPTSRASRIFTIGGTDLAARGYALEEYFVSGKANVYYWGADGKAKTPRVRTPNAPYTTRMVVRRPKKAQKFSGTVWVELNNPSRAYDAEIQWPAAREKFMRDGDVHIGLTVKPISIAALKRFDAERYGPLSMDNPLPPADQACGSLPGDAGYSENTSKLFENGLAWDIVSQVGALMRSGGPLKGFRVRNVFATGESQTAFYLNTYVNNFASEAKLSNGKPVYDGFVSVSGAGRPNPINQCVPATGVGDPRSGLPAKHEPFMRVDSQSEPFALGGFQWRREDSDDPKAGYRLYEIAGASHGWGELANQDVPQADVKASGAVPLLYNECIEPRWNSLPRQYIEPAFYANMERWVKYGRRPPHADPLQTTADGTGFVKDEFGNALGGVRNPYVDVPIATYNETASGGAFCRVLGHQVDFGSGQLQSLYVTRQNYVAKVIEATASMRRARFVEPEDAKEIVTEARYTRVP